MNISKIEQVKKLIEKAKKFQDFELLEMANVLLDEAVADWEPGVIGGGGDLPDHLIDHNWVPEPLPKKRGRPKKTEAAKPAKPVKISSKNIIQQFTIEKPENKMQTVPINLGPRKNKFNDDGKDFVDEEDKTPDYTPTKRDRPIAKPVHRVCGQALDGSIWDKNACGKDCYVDAFSAKKDLFVCEDCLLNKKKKGRRG